MPFNREYSLCCGGGGGRIWMETKKDERFSDIRIEQALETGAGAMALACPYCMSNFDDSVLTTGKEDELVISDVAELVAQAL
jgi:Fe-S oxidoreductase